MNRISTNEFFSSRLKGIMWFLMLVAVLRAEGTGTCADEDAFQRFTMESQDFKLGIPGAITSVGTITLEAVYRTNPSPQTCFRMTFQTRNGFTILKLRTGIRVQGVSIPFGKELPTKRKDIPGGGTVTKAWIDTCPTRIRSIATASCCESAFEVVAYAVVQGDGLDAKPTRAWPIADDSAGCRVFRPKKPFQLACPVEIQCLPDTGPE
uniref:Pherophorin domain-containing protein n=1 Tax=Rhodosorus marinus TaxID=101924 RepID=A0A7S2ZNQ7_9RHOD|mmetsp:Transcript_23587/g.93243  ORF Transcript_23587/g.93243 Transcript_23587/m.93243 type:complete len:208 (+) Transcript_23587:148-771(+)